ncbi:cytochrome c [uncultured Halomonas sp.]|uniref:c-type cytochrome n=1 Tax=uncultured Halomonas sp. TaxID=173971 RepID=UPI0026394C12|nr:cytochrome c [uncultured Halomonas sp.]
MPNTTMLPKWRFSSLGMGILALCGVLMLPTQAAAEEGAAREPAEVYRQVCAHCHALDKAVGPEITRAFPEAAHESWRAYIETTVRHGRAAMPSFRPAKISDAELEALSAALARGDLAEGDGGEE